MIHFITGPIIKAIGRVIKNLIFLGAIAIAGFLGYKWWTDPKEKVSWEEHQKTQSKLDDHKNRANYHRDQRLESQKEIELLKISHEALKERNKRKEKELSDMKKRIQSYDPQNTAFLTQRVDSLIDIKGYPGAIYCLEACDNFEKYISGLKHEKAISDSLLRETGFVVLHFMEETSYLRSALETANSLVRKLQIELSNAVCRVSGWLGTTARLWWINSDCLKEQRRAVDGG